MVKWAVDARFKADQLRLNIPEDPRYWYEKFIVFVNLALIGIINFNRVIFYKNFRSVPQVKYWIQWAVRQFNLTGIKLSDWSISGNELCALTIEEFR